VRGIRGITFAESTPMSNRTSTIKLQIELDENQVASGMQWQASDSAENAPKPCDAFLLSLWDPDTEETLRIDLWTKEMRKDQMDKFFFQTLLTMAKTYQRANGDAEIAEIIHRFGLEFGERTNLIQRETSTDANGSQS
jgi:gliding motility-associated protein GldC